MTQKNKNICECGHSIRSHETEGAWKKGCEFCDCEQSAGELELEIMKEALSRVKDADVVEPMGTYCAFCGVIYPLDADVAERIMEHVKVCEKHPMRVVERENARLSERLEASLSAYEGCDERRKVLLHELAQQAMVIMDLRAALKKFAEYGDRNCGSFEWVRRTAIEALEKDDGQ